MNRAEYRKALDILHNAWKQKTLSVNSIEEMIIHHMDSLEIKNHYPRLARNSETTINGVNIVPPYTVVESQVCYGISEWHCLTIKDVVFQEIAILDTKHKQIVFYLAYYEDEYGCNPVLWKNSSLFYENDLGNIQIKILNHLLTKNILVISYVNNNEGYLFWRSYMNDVLRSGGYISKCMNKKTYSFLNENDINFLYLNSNVKYLICADKILNR